MNCKEKVIQINERSYNVVETTECDIRDKDLPNSKWYVEQELYIISDGKKLGLAYDRNSRCYPIEALEYVIIFDCEWDSLEINDDRNGGWVRVVCDGRTEVFSLLGDYEALKSGGGVHKNMIRISGAGG